MKSVVFRWLLPLGVAVVCAILVLVYVRAHVFRASGNAMYPFLDDDNIFYAENIDTIHRGDVLMVVNPLDIKRETPRLSVSRCVALPGDKVQIYSKRLYINNVLQREDYSSFDTKILLFSPEEKRAAMERYHLTTKNDTLINTTFILTHNLYHRIKQDSIITKVEQCIVPDYISDSNLYPYSRQFHFNKDYYGPVTIPFKGMKIKLNAANYLYFNYLLFHGEGVKLEYRNGAYYLDGIKSDTYTFKHDYYFLLNDYRDNISDSRTFGPVSTEEVKVRVSSVIFK